MAGTMRRLFLNPDSPAVAGPADIDDIISFGLGGTRNIARATRVIEHYFQPLAASHLLESDFGMSPVKRTLNPAQVELDRAAIRQNV
jgi:hypothetical protein